MKKGLGVLLSCVAVLSTCVALGTWVGDLSERTKSVYPDMEIVVRVSPSEDRVLIENGNDYSWRDCEIKLNGKYVCPVDLVLRGDSVEVPTGEFAARDGVRFNSYTMKVLRVMVCCTKPDGHLDCAGRGR